MRQKGQVIKVEGGRIWVKTENGHACSNCSGCISITGEKKPDAHVIDVENTINADIGDWVVIETSSQDVAKVMITLYGIPLIGLLLGYFISFLVLEDDAVAGLGALAGLLISIFIARISVRRLETKVKKPQVVSLVSSSTPVH
ncbi:MAG: SoxR reducing system RseC family protein [Firmicutes bacterium]|jgi:positive regulator of sigma E activity|nr:SoxR reducing system RseC family protein [Bacillota bacterium]